MNHQQTPHNSRGKINKLMAKGDFKSAASLLHKFCQSDLRNAEARYLLSICLGRIGRWPEASHALHESIALQPEIAQLHFALGISQLELKQFRPAIESFRRTLKLDNTLTEAHIYLARACLILQDFSQSQQHYQKALTLNPDMAEAYYGLGCIEHETGNSESAIEFLEKALEHQPDSVDALRMMGSVLEKEGHIEKSAACYKKALLIDPGSVQAAAGLALIYEFRGDTRKAIELIDPLIIKHDRNPALGVAFAKICRHINRREEAVNYINRTLESPDLINNRIRKNLHFMAAELLDKLQRYDAAFIHFEAGNKVATNQLYDAIEHMQMIDDIISTYSPKLMMKMPRSTRHDSRPVFIVGMPRSGTSLTEQILAAHFDVHAAGELKILDSIIKEIPEKPGNTQKFPCRVSFLDQQDLDNIASRYLTHLDGLSSNARRITDKMPHNFYYLGIIQLLFPDARIIHLTRDPLDNALSIYFQNFSHGHVYANNLFNIGAHYHQYQRLMAHWKQVITLPFLEVSYEQLISDQVMITRQILEFCELEWNENCLQFHKVDRNVLTSSYDQVRQPLYTRSVGRWRNYEQYINKLKEGLQRDY